MRPTDNLFKKGELLHLDDEFGISVQWTNGLAMCHCEINVPSKSVIRRCKQTIHRLQAQYQEDAYGVCEKQDNKHKRFLKLMGFKFFKNKWVLIDGEDAIIEIWRLEYVKHRF